MLLCTDAHSNVSKIYITFEDDCCKKNEEQCFKKQYLCMPIEKTEVKIRTKSSRTDHQSIRGAISIDVGVDIYWFKI